MKTKTKTFDALNNKHEAARRLLDQLQGMTVEEEVAYWAAGTRRLLQRQEVLRSGQKAE